MKFKISVLTLLVNAVFLSLPTFITAQQLPEIIWSSVAHEPQSADFVSTYSIKFSPDGSRVIAGGNRRIGREIGSITVFNAIDGAFLNRTDDYFPIGSINQLDVSPDGQRITTAHNSAACDNNDQTGCRYSYILYNSQTLDRVSEPPTTFYASQSVDYAPDGQVVAVGEFFPVDNIKLLNPGDLSIIRTLPGHSLGANNGRTLSVRFSPDGQLLASGGGDDKVKIWRISDGVLLQTLTMNSSRAEVFSVEFSPDGQYIAATNRDNSSKVKIWRVSDGALVRTFENPYFYSVPLHKVTWTRDGRYVVTNFTTGSDGSRIRFWDFQTQTLAVEYSQPFVSPYDANTIRSVEFSADGRTFAFDIDESVLLARNPFASTATFADFNGDGDSDPAVFRDGNWYMQEGANNLTATKFGLPTDEITPADFDGDGKTDVSVFRDGTWYWVNSSNGGFNARQFGAAGDVPVPADFTGDGRAELAIYRSGVWWIHNLTSGESNTLQFGIASDTPVPADFDGDGKTDITVFREGIWHYLRSSDNNYRAVQFGIASDIPAVGDFDGDRKNDQAVYRGGNWYVLGSTRGFYAVQFGVASDIPTAADYDGDGKTDLAVFRDGIWYLLRSQAGFGTLQLGATNDRPIQAAFMR